MSKAAKRKASRRGSAKRVRTPEELEIKSTLAAIQEEQEETAGCDDSDYVLRHMLEHKIPLTQANYLDMCYWGAKPTVNDLDFEEQADLPDSFFAWPIDEDDPVN
jgi:hypothetical protein